MPTAPLDPPGPLVPPDPPLADDVVLLRPWSEDDLDQLVAACQDPDIRRFIPIPDPYGTTEGRQYLERTRAQWADGSKAAFAIVERDDPTRLLGAINVAIFGAVGNSGYWIAPGARRRGVATRALRLLSDWALHHLELAVVLLEIRPENTGSLAVAHAVGFRDAGKLDVNTATGKKGGLILVRMISDQPGHPG